MADPRVSPYTGRPKRKFWGWGFLHEGASEEERSALLAQAAKVTGLDASPVSVPAVEEFALSNSELSPPSSLAAIVTDDAEERLNHAYGKSYADAARMFLRQVEHAPDLVAFPKNEQDVTAVLDWADSKNIAVIPYGGGSSVCGGVEADVGEGYAGAISLDLAHLNKILEIDRTSRAARIQAGILGPELEAQLKPHNLTLRHFPQSFEQSTLGGWIATRSGGHYATRYTHIDDFVESTRSVTPSGILETRRLPGSGAGPSADRLMAGSEGILGVITEA